MGPTGLEGWGGGGGLCAVSVMHGRVFKVKIFYAGMGWEWAYVLSSLVLAADTTLP